ncbi:hypothetical protein BC835DRAFT_1347868 [Cytidiella melzeri]|nr:hypothetical protein BC835DRAFT_1347868 [Cytidiella melzeri]
MMTFPFLDRQALIQSLLTATGSGCFQLTPSYGLLQPFAANVPATMDVDDSEATPWYRKRHKLEDVSKLFVLTKMIYPKTSPQISPSFFCVAAFPWHLNSLASDALYDISSEKMAEISDKWEKSIQPWIGSVMVGSTGCAWIFRKLGPPLCIKVPRCTDEFVANALGRDVKCVAWALDPTTWTTPLVILAAFGMIFVYNPTTCHILSRLRGHGGEITSIAVHHIHPYRFLTTSRDQTTRLYDLRYRARQSPNNPHWLPSKHPSNAGAGFGLHVTGSEGDGLGRCIGLLAGGLSGGHQAAVLHAAWHPTLDLIATCGADCAVKIWRMPYVDFKKVDVDSEHLAREDKPLFSTNFIHKSRVLSIWWLSRDILMSHSAPALVRGKSVDEMYEEPGIVAAWQWLSFDRFLRNGLKKVMRGACEDWRKSGSFKLLSVYSVPMATPSIHVSTSPTRKHDPLLFVPDGVGIRIFNITRFSHREPPMLPLDEDIHNAEDEDELENLTRAMHLTNEYSDVGEADDAGTAAHVYRRERPELELFEEVEGWIADGRGVSSDAPRLPAELFDIEKCEIAFGGRVILGVGKGGMLCSWKLAV